MLHQNTNICTSKDKEVGYIPHTIEVISIPINYSMSPIIEIQPHTFNTSILKFYNDEKLQKEDQDYKWKVMELLQSISENSKKSYLIESIVQAKALLLILILLLGRLLLSFIQ